MCLTNDRAEVEKILKRNPARIIAYKVLRRGDSFNVPTLVSPFAYTNLRGWPADPWQPGERKSDSKQRKLAKTHRRTIDKGIHVYRSKKEAERLVQTGGYFPNAPSRTYRVVPVLAHIKDLLGANEKQLVFRKVKLSKRSYNKAITS